MRAGSTGDAYGEPDALAGIARLVRDARQAESFSRALVWRSLETIRSLESRVRQLDGRLVAGERHTPDLRAEQDQLREWLCRAEAQLKRATADKKRAHRLRQAAEQRAENWAHRYARTGPVAPRTPDAPVSRRTHTPPPLPYGTFPGGYHEVLRAIAGDLDDNARELGRLGELLRAKRGKRLAAVLLGLVAVMASVAVVVFGKTPFLPRPGHSEARGPTPRASAFPSTSAVPPKPPARTPSRAPQGPGPEGHDGKAPPPSPDPSPTAPPKKSTPRPPAPPETTAPHETPGHVAGEIFIVRGHHNEMNVNLTGFEPGKDVTIHAYSDDGPYDQRTFTIRPDGTREFGAFPMGAPGRYWVEALGVRSNVISWTG